MIHLSCKVVSNSKHPKTACDAILVSMEHSFGQRWKGAAAPDEPASSLQQPCFSFVVCLPSSIATNLH
jgi:hypothetical protein